MVWYSSSMPRLKVGVDILEPFELVEVPAALVFFSAAVRKRPLLAPVEFRTRPRPEYDCSLSQLSAEPVKIPKLLRAYLSLGAKICGPPALDRQFKTIDFFDLLDLDALPLVARQRFLD